MTIYLPYTGPQSLEVVLYCFFGAKKGASVFPIEIRDETMEGGSGYLIYAAIGASSLAVIITGFYVHKRLRARVLK